MDGISNMGGVRVVMRVEIATLLTVEGKLDPLRMDRLTMICTNLRNSGIRLAVVSSGAIVLGSARMGMSPPTTLTGQQAAAAIGQAELISQYQRYFESFHQMVAQVLITKDVISNESWSLNTRNTFNRLFDMGIIPVVNENDSVSTADIELGDNYPLAFDVAKLIDAHAIVIRLPEEGQYYCIGRRGIWEATNEEGLFRWLGSSFLNDGNLQNSEGEFPSSLPEVFDGITGRETI